jgi:hypothetical protein
MRSFIYGCVHYFGWIIVSKVVLWKLEEILQTIIKNPVSSGVYWAESHVLLNILFVLGLIVATARFYIGVWITGFLIRRRGPSPVTVG